MSNAAAQAIVRRALELSHLHPSRPALEILDLAMQGHLGSAPDFSMREVDGDALCEPQRRFGELLRQAFAPRLEPGRPVAAREQWQREVLTRFADRYQLWRNQTSAP
jgi:hypothetical protein